MFCETMSPIGIASFLFLISLVVASAAVDFPEDVTTGLRHEQQEEQEREQKDMKQHTIIPTKFIGPNVHGDPVYLPLIGAGTWQYNDDEAYESVCKAFGAGYTFVDTAYGYKNQKGVGRAIKDCWKGKREDLFVLTKIPGGLNTTEVQTLHENNLEELGLDYVDHLMTHFPADWEHTNAGAKARQEEWLALEDIYKTGEAQTIGISHYCSKHILDILWVATVTPALNQVEYHVGSQDIDQVIETCSDFGITFMSFSPLCGPCSYEPSDSLVNGNLVTNIAAEYKHRNETTISAAVQDNNFVTGSQVALRYIVQQGIPVIPKSNTMSHILSNFQIFDFELSDAHMERLGRATKPAAESGDCDVGEVEAIVL
uniref:NADP-dependent oxidoreductase domain-containing protein n=1 Tax=Pseudo-nitzschia australis TaxID=44445 RepID=A0A7S4AXL1_9STRA|mmetsp:Transcript_3225/g.6956  ORF Transcript_3225/g.6956 Transcript_3225/m.6956 type:complete len:370 (-) Transcript_3225:64-1173(-)